MVKRIAFLLVCLFLSKGVWGKSITLFVSEKGNDNNIGTIDQPLKTLWASRDKMRFFIEKDPKAERIIYLREGNYSFSKTFSLNEKDSGRDGAPFIIKAYQNEKVSFSGGIEMPIKRIKKVKSRKVLNRLPESAEGHVYQVNLKSFSIPVFGEFGPRGFNRPYIAAPNELFIDGKAQSIARWPNEGEDLIPMGKIHDPGSVPRKGDYSNKGGTFEWNTDRPERWEQAKDVYISGFFQWGYADDAIKLAQIDQKNKTFTTAQPHLYGFGNKHPWNAWFAINLLEEIDQPGEYFLDRENQMLYFYSPKPVNEIKKVQLSVLEQPMVSLQNTSFVHFEGITFECTRGMGVYIEKGEKNLLKGCAFRNIGMVAVSMGKGIKADSLMHHDFTGEETSGEIGSLYTHLYQNTAFNRKAGRGHGIVDCDMYDIGAGAIVMGGGDRLTLTPGENYVYNCHIHHFNRLDRTYKSAINIDGVGNKIQHCLIHDAPGTAIYLHGNDHLVEYNEVYNVMMDGDDQGAYYLGRDPSEFNNVVRYNYFHHIGISPTTHRTWTIYYDDGSCGNIAYGNVFYKAGKGGAFLVGGGKYNKIYNNIFVDCSLGIHVDNRQQNWAKSNVAKGGIFEKRLNIVNFDKPPYSTRYPELARYWEDDPAVPSNLIEKNLLYKTKRLVNSDFKTTTLRDNWMVDEDPGFNNLGKKNFSLQEESEVFNHIPGFKKVPFLKMGLKETSFRSTLIGEDGLLDPQR